MTTLISKEVQLRNKQKQKEKNEQQIALAYKTAGLSNQRQKQVDASVNDDYMKNALSQVRNIGNVSIDVEFARFNGTSLYNTESKAPGSHKKTEIKVKTRTSITENSVEITPTPRVENPVKSKSKSNEVTWNKICEQLDHPRLVSTKSTSFFGQLRESLQTKNKSKLLNLKRSVQS